MKLVTLILLIGMSTSGCARIALQSKANTHAKYLQEKLQPYVGKTKGEIVKELGAPFKTLDAGGYEIYYFDQVSAQADGRNMFEFFFEKGIATRFDSRVIRSL